MELHENISQEDAYAKGGDQFALFEQVVSFTAHQMGIPGYAVMAVTPIGMAICAGGADDEAKKLCCDMAMRLGTAMVQRVEESQGETGMAS